MEVAFRGWVPEVLWGALRTIVLGVAGSLVAACVAPFPPELEAENHGRVAKVLANAYEEVTENYVARVEAADLAVAGLANLSQLEPDFSVQADAGAASLKLHDEELYSFSRPADDDIDAWADAVADALILARSQSYMLRGLSAQRIFENQMEGIAGALDRGARYSNGDEWRDILMPKYDGGILFTFRGRESGFEVLRLDPDGRLEAEGLRKGHVISHIDFTPVKSLTWLDLQRRLVGPVGSTVVLTVLRGELPASTDLRVSRWKVEAPSYQLVRQGSIAVLRLPYLNFRATYDLERGLGTELRKARYGQLPLTGLVLDVRGNLGGGEWAATELANSFLGKGVISIQRDYRPEPKNVVNASWPDHSDNLPLVVLIDGFTGSSVEDVVAALQDNGRALVIGSSTEGDGVVRQGVRLFNMGSIWMPVAFSHAPSGYGIAGRGVMPDICTSIPGRTLEGLLTALRRSEGLTDTVTRTRHINPDDSPAVAAHRALCPAEINSSDLAYELGLAILQDSGLYARLMAQRAGF